MLQLALDLTRNGHCECRKAVQEVRGPVERVDDPDGVTFARPAAFLGQKGMTGVVLADDLDDLGLGRMIDFAYEVVASFRGDRQGFEAVETADDDFAGGAGGADGDIEKRVHGKMSSAETYQRIVAD